MERELATEFAKKYLEFGQWFTEVTELTLRVPNEGEAKLIRNKLAEMSFALDDAVFRPLSKEHPGLFDS